MNCQYQESLVPRCQIVMHPDRDNVEYCRVCGEWRYLDSIGHDHANLFWLLLAMAIVGMVMAGLLNDAGQPLDWQTPQRSQPIRPAIVVPKSGWQGQTWGGKQS